MVWKQKLNKLSLPQAAFGHGVYHSKRERQTDRGQRFLKETHGEVPGDIEARNGSLEPSGSHHDDSDDKLLRLVGSEVSGIR